MKQQREDKLSHINEDGKASMVNINEKKNHKKDSRSQFKNLSK